MSTQEKLNNIYKLYSEKKYSEAFLLVQEILKEEPGNIYAKKYEKLIKPFLNDKSEVGKITTVKGKNLKCPHCESSISLSALNEEQKTKIRNNDYSNLSLKCPYCHTIFTLQKKSSNSLIGIKIGDQISYNGKKYRVVGCVDYFGRWYESHYSGNLNYLEWILLGEDNSYIYFSEGYFVDDGEKNYEFEFSHKIIPNFSISFGYNGENLIIDGKKIYIYENNIVEAKGLYGENSKVFTVGEKIELFEFSFKGKNYVLEKEKVGRQSEAGIYETESISQKKACEIFGKEYKSLSKISLNSFGENGPTFIILFFIFFPTIISFLISIFSFIFNPFILLLIFIIALVVIGKYFPNLYSSKKFHLFVSGPIFGIILIPMILNNLETKEEILLKDLVEGKKFQVEFEDSSLKKTSVKSTKKYDYGGIRTYYETVNGLKFSIKSLEDKEIIKKIQKNEGLSEDLQKIFSQKIYKVN
ncbi:hypothetical protein DLH72_05320 [Candidatus Gracilibacteria bacterium]|nr:MAG: hypothetical protein DLH72_05320 [Candidatus Gracilibacteria bacterium]